MPTMKELRATLSEARPKMKIANAAFLNAVEDEFENAGTAGDYRHVRARISDHTKELLDKPGKADAETMAVIDGYFAMIDIIDMTMTAQADGDRHFASVRGATPVGWHDPETNKPITVLASDERFADRAPARRSESGSPIAGVGELVKGYLVGAKGGSDGIRGATPAHIRAALSEGTDGAGGYTIPLDVMTPFIDRLRARTTFVQAGARR